MTPRHSSSHRDTSPAREKRSGRTKSPKRQMSHSPSRRREDYPQKKPRHEKSRSPSPRTKRLLRAQADTGAEKDRERSREGKRRERDVDRISERDHEKRRPRGRETEEIADREEARNYGRGGGDRNTHRERDDADRENGGDRKERIRLGRDENDGKSSRARNGRSASPSHHHYRSRNRSRSPSRKVDRRERDEVINSRASEQRNDDEDSVAKMKAAEEALDAKQKQKPSFELSGKLASETNRVKGVTLLFTEPPEARKPDVRWRLYVFKAGDVLNEPLYIHRQSCYLFGRERRVADIPTDHPSCSKQHAVIQYRQVEKEQPDGTLVKQPRICTIARELCNLMGVGISPGASRRFGNTLIVYHKFEILLITTTHCPSVSFAVIWTEDTVSNAISLLV